MLIQKNIPLHDKNWFQTGGPAKYYCRPTTAQEFQEAVQFAHAHKLPMFVLGEGANILISDYGFDGLVIHPAIKTIDHDIQQATVTAGAGVGFSNLIEYCLSHHLLGLEEFSGIPGTVGGSVFINIHYFEFLLGQFLVKAQIIDNVTGEILNVDNAWFNFGYNQTKLHDKRYFLITATFVLKSCTALEAAFARGRRTEIIRHRNQRYPISHTCGSFFRNFYENEVTLMSNGKKLIFVAYYLDKIGIKGQLSIGGAIISYKHANMLVNQGNATSNDLIQLARQMQLLVFKHFGILPQAECQCVGFKEYPLLTNAIDITLEKNVEKKLNKENKNKYSNH